MKEICYNSTPQVKVRIYVSQMMQQDFKECQEMFRAKGRQEVWNWEPPENKEVRV